MRRPCAVKKLTDPPTIYGVLCDEDCTIPRGLARRLAERTGGSVLLPFHVEGRHLRNVFTCMRLMDIQGLVVTGRHRERIVAMLPSVDALALRANAVDTIVRRGAAFSGAHAGALAFQRWCRDHLPRRAAHGVAFLAGTSDGMTAAAAALSVEGYRVVRLAAGRTPNASLPRAVRTLASRSKAPEPSIIVMGRLDAASRRRISQILEDARGQVLLAALEGRPRLKTNGTRVFDVHLEKMTPNVYDTCVDLLTSAPSPTV